VRAALFPVLRHPPFTVEELSMFKWVCLLVAVVALSAFGWMLNDIRLELRSQGEKLDKHLPRILAQTDQVTAQLDQRLPRLLTQADRATTMIEDKLPRLLAQSEKAATLIDRDLPRLIASTERAEDGVTELTCSLNEYKGVFGATHSTPPKKGLLSYGLGILDFLDGQDARIGVKQTGPTPGLKHAQPAKQWTKAARPQVAFQSAGASSKGEMLDSMARTNTTAPWYIQAAGQAPRLLGDFLKETHPESKNLN
jgi:hypothetical protein